MWRVHWQNIRGFDSANVYRRPYETWGRSSRPMRAAWVALAIVLILPVIALIFAAVVAALLVYAALSVVDTLIGTLRSVWMRLTGTGSPNSRPRSRPGHPRSTWSGDGRRNVRVIR